MQNIEYLKHSHIKIYINNKRKRKKKLYYTDAFGIIKCLTKYWYKDMQYIYKIIQLECHFKSDALFIYIQEEQNLGIVLSVVP